MKDTNILSVFSTDNLINQKLKNLQLESKVFVKLIHTIALLGDFDNSIEVFAYKTDDKKEWQQVWCFDKNDNIFIFYITSSDKRMLSKVY